MINKVTLIGNLGKEPEIKTVGNDKKMSKFSIATSESYKDKDGEWKQKTQWHNVTAWSEVKADKGDTLYVEGKIEYREHEGKYYTDIIATYTRKMNTGQKVESVKAEIVQSPGQTDFEDGLPF
jgi:single-strand DNA-binding protein